MNVRVLWVLLVLWLSGSAAALGGHATCGVNATPAVAQNGSSSFDMLTFAPDAQCWFNQTVEVLATSGVFHAVDGLAAAVMTILFVTTVIIPFVTDPKSRGARMIISAITYVVFGSITISAARNEPGNAIDTIREYMFKGWTSIYIPSANMGSSLINAHTGSGSVTANLQGIANQVAKLDYDATIYQRRQYDLMIISTNATRGVTSSTQSQVDALIKDDQSKYKAPTGDPGMWTNIGFFLLLGVFAVFAAIVYSTGFGVIIASLLLSIAFAFAAAGNFSVLKTTLNTTLAAFLSTLVVPFTVSVVIAIAFGTPTASMLRNLTADTTAVHTSLQTFTSTYQNCALPQNWTNITCSIDNVGANISATWEMLRTEMVGLLTIVIGMIVSLGIGLSQLRRVPALIGSMLGVSGGGESSGTGANPLGTIAEALGVVAAGRALGRNMVGKGVKGGKTEKSDSDDKSPPSPPPDSGTSPAGPGSSSASVPTATAPASVTKPSGNPMAAQKTAAGPAGSAATPSGGAGGVSTATPSGGAGGVTPTASPAVMGRPKVSPAGTGKTAASPPPPPAASAPSVPANTGEYGSPQNRPPLPINEKAPLSGKVNIPSLNSPAPAPTGPAPAKAQPTQVMTNPGAGMGLSSKASAGAGKSLPSDTNAAPPEASSGVTKSSPTPAPVVTAQNAYRGASNKPTAAQSGPVAAQTGWKTAQPPAAPAPTPTSASPATRSTPQSGSLPPSDYEPPDSKPTPAQPQFSPRMDARRKTT